MMGIEKNETNIKTGLVLFNEELQFHCLREVRLFFLNF